MNSEYYNILYSNYDSQLLTSEEQVGSSLFERLERVL